MAYKKTEKLIKYNNDFNKKKYDRINLMVAKGKKNHIKSHAEGQSESMNSFINRAIDEAITRDNEKNPKVKHIQDEQPNQQVKKPTTIEELIQMQKERHQDEELEDHIPLPWEEE